MNYRAGILLIALIWSVTVQAARITVDPDTANLQHVLDNAASGDEIYFHIGTYTLNLTVKSGLILTGEETARTVLRSASTGNPVLSINALNDVEVKHLTFADAALGISINGASTNIRIRNNVFNLGVGNVGIDVIDTSIVEVEFNTFYQNGTALRRAADGVTLKNNIFSNNTLAVSAATAVNIDYNCFGNNSDNGMEGSNTAAVVGSLQFVEPGDGDFHLRQDAYCIDAGTGTDAIDGSAADAGAYGGANADERPFPVQNLQAATSTENDTVTLSLSWDANNSYLITHDTDPGS